MDNEAVKFIDRLYRNLYLTEEVVRHSTGSRTDKFRNIKEYFDNQEDMHRRASTFKNRINILKRLYHERYVIKENDILDSYYELQQTISFNRGNGHLILDDVTKKRMQDEVIKNQEESLDRWIDYFLDNNKQSYPFWIKYWAFQGMLKLGSYNEKSQTYNKRTKYTTAPFINLNEDALYQTINLIILSLNNEKIDDEKLKKMVDDGSFQMLYTYFLEKERKKSKKNEGIWIKYDRGGDYKKLAESVSNISWCTRGVGTAEAQLALGDFYIYYTLDEENHYTVPRVAIRMEDDNIAEIRGIGLRQNVEPVMQSVVEEKLKEFSNGDEYYKKIENMDKITKIYNKNKNGVLLSREELRFLYEIDEYIVGFGQIHDLRISDIIDTRDVYLDLSIIFDYDVKKLNDNYIYDLEKGNIMKPDNPLFPKVIFSKRFPLMKKIDNMVFPDIFIGSMFYGGVESIRNTKFPKKINDGKYNFGGGDLILGCMNSRFENVQLPDEISGELSFSADVVNNVRLPKIVRANAVINVNSASNLTLPEEIYGWFILDINTTDDIILPKEMKKAITIKSLTHTNGSLKFPDGCWSIELPDMIDGKNLVLPKMIQYDLILNKMVVANDMKLPEIVGRNLNLSELVDGTNLVLPTNIGGSLDIRSLTKMDKMVLPKCIDEDLHISYFAYEYFGKEAIESIVSGKILIYDEDKKCINDVETIKK